MRRRILFLLLFFISHAVLAEEITTIPAVKITAKKKQTNKNFTAVTATHFNRKKIAASSATTLNELLQQQSAIRLAASSGDSSQVAFSLRGFGDNAVANSLILVDGFPLINPTLLTPNFNSILLSDIEKIDILQGSQGTLGGNQAVGGIINIETRHPEKLFGNITANYGSYNQQFLSGILGDKFANGISFKLAGFTNQTDNYRVHNQQTSNGFTSQLGLDYARGSLLLNQKMYTYSTNFPGGLTEQQFINDPTQATDTQNYTQYTTYIYQLLNKQALSNQWLLETRMAYNTTRGNGFVFSPFHNTQWLTTVNPQLIGYLHTNKITLGYSWQNSFYQDSSTQIQSRAKTEQNDIYAQTVTPIFNKLDLTLGARAAWQKNAPEIVIDQPVHYTNHVLVTEQGLAFHPDDVWTFFIRRDGNFRFPKANEQVWLPINITTLKPQTGVSYESGIERQTAVQLTQLNFYRLALNNEIAFDPTQTPLQPFGATSNLAQTLRRGFSLAEYYHLTPEIDVNGQVNYVAAYFSAGQYAGNKIPAVPAWSANSGISYQFLPHWKTNYSLLYIGSRYAAQDVANVSKKNPSYFLSKVGVQYLYKQLHLSFEVNNLFNQRYAAYTVYNSFTQQNSYYPGAGRNFLFALQIDFS